MNWLTKGDKNTKFFRAYDLERKKRNRIKYLKKDDSRVVEAEEEMAAEITNYFSNLFSSSAGTRMDELLPQISPSVTREMNENLLADFSAQEIKEALDSVGDLTAPGLDGMPAIFYKKFWALVGPKVTQEVLHILNGGEIPTS